MITLKNVDKYFFRHKKNEIHVINDTSLEFDKTGFVALLGPSGCGKTTLLNAIGGLDKINSGSIYINGVKMPRVGSSRKDKMRVLNIGYIFQDYNLLDQFSVYDNVALSLKMIGIKNKGEIKRRVDYILELVGMYRYRNKPAGMLSGGQRQRVGIARALVKNPEVIIADEPTGNLDSKNTIEIMNIIKTISKEKLVILVTHEKDLAYFYASRIVTLEDGKVLEDKMNVHENELDYKIDNKIYLKDFKNRESIESKSNDITIFSDKKEKLSLDIVVKNGNIYIKSKNDQKIEVVDEDSGIEFIDGNYKKISKEDYEKSKFDLKVLDNHKYSLKYSSIYNFTSMIKAGIKKVFNYSMVKKILLAGFFFSAMFIMYALSSIFGATNIEDENFLDVGRDYIVIENNQNRLDEYLKVESMPEVSYAIPGSSKISIELKNPKLWQLTDFSRSLEVSVASDQILKQENVILGRLPAEVNEVVFDSSLVTKAFKSDNTFEWMDVHENKDFIGLSFTVGEREFKIVGISDSKSPCIYFKKDVLFDVIAEAPESEFTYGDGSIETYKNYEVMKDKIVLKEGRAPLNDYEAIVNIDNKELMPLDKDMQFKIGDRKLKVVGYYTADEYMNHYIVNSNTYKHYIILKKSNIMLVARDKDEMITKLQDEGYNAIDGYVRSRREYIETIKDNIKEASILAGILLAISFIEIFLMIRASFLSRIKEVGIYRAIGVKKTDIYKMFLGEILVITTLASLPGAIFMGSILNEVTKISFFRSTFVMNSFVFLVGIVLIYLLNIIVGLLPIRSTLSKTPAEILSRNDVD